MKIVLDTNVLISGIYFSGPPCRCGTQGQAYADGPMKIPAIGRNDPCPFGSGKKFKKCCRGKEQSDASCHGVTGVSTELRQALEGKQFNSLEEAQAFVEHLALQQNQRPLDEFHGL
ncbi:MAG: SEC-C metal-binding domain-containing protein [Pseudomonadota bacterium]|nr:SEC-C metal-binding domain-containing protein [Pseudomonadota bacterium]